MCGACGIVYGSSRAGQTSPNSGSTTNSSVLQKNPRHPQTSSTQVPAAGRGLLNNIRSHTPTSLNQKEISSSHSWERHYRKSSDFGAGPSVSKILDPCLRLTFADKLCPCGGDGGHLQPKLRFGEMASLPQHQYIHLREGFDWACFGPSQTEVTCLVLWCGEVDDVTRRRGMGKPGGQTKQ